MSYEQSSDEYEKIISKRATYFKNCKVHLSLKDGKGWENGWIKEVGADYLVLSLTEQGILKHSKEDLLFFFVEIDELNEFRETSK